VLLVLPDDPRLGRLAAQVDRERFETIFRTLGPRRFASEH
jgi:hypothetical protein